MTSANPLRRSGLVPYRISIGQGLHCSGLQLRLWAAIGLLLVAALVPLRSVSASEFRLKPEDVERSLHDVLATVRPGDSVVLPPGKFSFSRELTLAVRKVTITGSGPDATILDFAGQKSGAQSFVVRGNDIVLEGFSILDPPSDGLVIRGGRAPRVSRIAVSWTSPELDTHGGYGIYPVMTRNAVIENCVASGAREAGIYLGQSSSAEIRGNHVSGNVIGIDVENSSRVAILDNTVVGNSVGIVVSARPRLMKEQSAVINLAGNAVEGNDLASFAVPDSYVSAFGEGIGVALVAVINAEVASNSFTGHSNSDILLLSYESLDLPGNPVHRTDPFLKGIRIGKNAYDAAPSGAAQLGPSSWHGALGTNVLWDGIVAPGRSPDQPGVDSDESRVACIDSVATNQDVVVVRLSSTVPSLPACAPRPSRVQSE